MAKVPNPENAVVETRKLRVRRALLAAALSEEALVAEEDEYGQRYMLGFEMSTEMGSAVVRSGWMVRSGEDFPRFTSCWVL